MERQRTVYIASRFTNRELVKALTAKLLTLDPPIFAIQTWPLDGDITPEWTESKLAEMDLNQIDSVQTVVVLTEGCEQTPGGMNFEAGYAWGQFKHLVVVGPRVNIFYHQKSVEWYPNIPAFLKALQEVWV
jgi:hypothetical protein